MVAQKFTFSHCGIVLARTETPNRLTFESPNFSRRRCGGAIRMKMAVRQTMSSAAASISRLAQLRHQVTPTYVSRAFSNASGEVELKRDQVSGQIGMPVKRSLYTVLRSPHVDKKSREQFKTEVKREFVVMKVESDRLANKLFWLKRRKDFGTMEIKINVKTRFPRDRKDLFQSQLTASKNK